MLQCKKRKAILGISFDAFIKIVLGVLLFYIFFNIFLSIFDTNTVISNWKDRLIDELLQSG